MLIPIPIGMKYTGSAWGSAIKEITCEHCGAEFCYELRRMAQGHASAVAFIGKQSAQERSMAAAESRLAKALNKGNDPVPCPSCGKLQARMNRSLQLRWIKIVVIAWIAALFVAMLGFVETNSFNRPTPSWIIWLVAGSSAASIAAIVWIFTIKFRARSIGRGQLKSDLQIKGYASLARPLTLADGWLWLRATTFVSPPVCAGCGGPPDQLLERPVGPFRIKVQICGSCRRATMMRRALWAIASGVAPILVGLMIVFLFTDADGFHIFSAVMLGGFAGGLALFLAFHFLLPHVGAPLQARKFNLVSDSVELRFKSAQAAATFIAIAASRANELQPRENIPGTFEVIFPPAAVESPK